MATTKVINDLIDLNQTGNTTALKGCKGTTAQQPGETGQPAAVEGMLRTNTDLTSNSSASAMQFYKNTGSLPTSGWVTLTNTKNSTLGDCNYPTASNGLALYQFNDDVSDTCIPAYDGAALNAAYGTGKFAGSKAFDFSANTSSYTGTSSYITYSYAGLSMANDWSWSFWIYAASTPTQYATIASFYNGYTNYLIWNSNFNLYMYTNGGGGSNNVTTGITAGGWNHIVWTKSSSTGNALYLNGNTSSPIYTDSVTSNAGTVSGANSIGMHASTGSNWGYPLDGGCKIDQFRVYNTALTTAQVTLLYNES